MLEYLQIMKSVPVFARKIVRESDSYKIYLPKDYVELWDYLWKLGERVDIVVFLHKEIMMIDKIVLRNHKIVREYNKYKVYLDRRYAKIWEKIMKDGEKIDAVILIK